MNFLNILFVDKDLVGKIDKEIAISSFQDIFSPFKLN